METASGLFVSYDRNNSDLVDHIADLFENYQLTYWIDRRRLVVGDDWTEKIHQAIKDCTAFLLVATPRAMNSASVKDEIDYAIKYNKPVILVTYKNVKIPFFYRKIAKAEFLMSTIMNDIHYKLIRFLNENDLYVITATGFNPFLVLARVYDNKAPKDWKIFHESKINLLGRWFAIISPYLLLILPIILAVLLNFQTWLKLPAIRTSTLTIILIYICASLLLASLIACIFVYYVSSFAYGLNFIKSFPSYGNLLNAIHARELGVLTPQGFAIRMRYNKYEREQYRISFKHEYLDFKLIDSMSVSNFEFQGTRLTYRTRDLVVKNLYLTRSFGRTKHRSKLILRNYEVYKKEINTLGSNSLSEEWIEANKQEQVIVAPHLIPSPQNRQVTIIHSYRTRKMASMIQNHLTNRIIVSKVNLDKKDEGMISITAGASIIILRAEKRYESFINLIKASEPGKVFLLPIQINVKKTTLFPSLQWVDFSKRNRYRLGYVYIDYTLYQNGFLPLPVKYKFDSNYILAEAIFSNKPSFPVFKVDRSAYRFNVWQSVIGGFFAINSIVSSFLVLPSLVSIYLFTQTFLVMYYRRYLKNNVSMPEIVAITTTGGIFSWRNLWLNPWRHRLLLLPFDELRFISVIPVPFFFKIILYANKKSARIRLFALPEGRFDTFAIASTLLRRWEAYKNQSRARK